MNYRGLLYKYYTTAFDNVNIFDTFSFQEVEKLFLENQRQILDTNLWRVEDTLNRDSFIKKEIDIQILNIKSESKLNYTFFENVFNSFTSNKL